MPLFKNKWEVSEELLEELRSKFLDELKSGPEVPKLYHADDVERVKKNDWFLVRYLLHKERDVEQALRMLKESLKFRNDLKVNTLKEEDLPPEYFAPRCVIQYNKDRLDLPIVVVRAAHHFKNLEMRYVQQQFFMYWVEKTARETDWGAMSILFDLTDAGYGNLDMDMMRFMMQVFNKHYPWGLGYFMVYNMPWYLSTIWKIVRQWIPEKRLEKIVFVDRKSIQKYIDKDQLPVVMGGECTDLYAPKDS